MTEGGVERRALSLPGIGEASAQEPDSIALVALDDARRVVARRVVNDEDREVVGRQRQQTFEAFTDDDLLVQARQHEDEEKPIGRRQ